MKDVDTFHQIENLNKLNKMDVKVTDTYWSMGDEIHPFTKHIEVEDLVINKMIIECAFDLSIKNCKINLIIFDSWFLDNIFIQDCKIRRLMITGEIFKFSARCCGIKQISISEPPFAEVIDYEYEKIKDYSRYYNEDVQTYNNKYLNIIL
jgi:hypothetical protein